VQALLTDYETLRDKCDNKIVHVRLIDLSRALNHLVARKRLYALSIGRLTQTRLASAVGVSQPAVSKGLSATLDDIVNYLNGEHE
jgi:hypothetical protein